MLTKSEFKFLSIIFRKGNRASVWEMLIKEKKLPYMAMVRNIRNMIMAGINDEVVKLAVNYLTNEKAVVKSRMFPYRFYKAYEVLDELQVFKEKNFQVFDRNHTNLTKEERKKIEGLEKKFKELKTKQKTMNDKAIDIFKKALDTAVEIATNQNIPPIRGITVIMLQLTNDNDSNKLRTDVLFALMVLKSCEQAKLYVANSCPCMMEKYYEITIKSKENSLLELVKDFEKIRKLPVNHWCNATSQLPPSSKTSEGLIETHEYLFYAIDLIR